MKSLLNLLNRKRLSHQVARISPQIAAARLRNPVFVIGVARSGKTTLAKLLAQAPSVSYWPEANEIWDPDAYPWRTSRRTTPPIWIDPDAYTERWWSDNQDRIKQIRAIFGSYQWLSRGQIFLNDTPLNTFRIPQLLRAFPEARFIHVIRDGRQVVLEHTSRVYRIVQQHPGLYEGMGVDTFETLAIRLATFWKMNIEEIDRQDKRLDLSRRGRLMETTYEALWTETEVVLERVCAFVGLESVPPHVSSLNKNGHERGHDERLDAPTIPGLETALEPTLSSRGYH